MHFSHGSKQERDVAVLERAHHRRIITGAWRTYRFNPHQGGDSSRQLLGIALARLVLRWSLLQFVVSRQVNK